MTGATYEGVQDLLVDQSIEKKEVPEDERSNKVIRG